MRQYFTSHITTIMNKFKGRCYAWDVVNEPMELNGTLRLGARLCDGFVMFTIRPDVFQAFYLV